MTTKVPCSNCGTLILPETGTKTGGRCMACFKDPSRGTPSPIVGRARAVPPRILSPFVARRPTPLVERIESFERAVAFQVSCPCQSDSLLVLGYPSLSDAYPDELGFLAPVSLECAACHRTAQLFDPSTDGHDGEQDSSAGAIGQGTPKPFACRVCSKTAFQVGVEFRYDLEDVDMQDWPEFAAAPQNFFTSVSFVGECLACRDLNPITGYECA